MSNLIFPKAVLDQHLVILGKTGAGKSSALRYVVEHLLDHGKRVCIVDPKGDWWGLKSAGDGKSAGYPVIAFGDFKEPKASDVPINAHSGGHVAELITSGNRPCIIGFRGWMIAHMVQFWIDFAAGIFNANSGELFLVGDEYHNFAPKGKIMDPQAGKCLHWSNRLLSEGRGLGIVCLLASQRPQKVHNDTLTSCETLVAMRVVHSADRKAVEEWIKGCGDEKQGKEVLDSLAGMARGEAFVWSPEIGFGPKRITFPMFQTFDSFAPPQLQKRVSEKGWADVDLTAVREKLAAVIEKAKADDPKELRKRIAELEKKLRERPAETREVEKIVEVPVLKNGQLDRTEKIAARMESEGQRLLAESAELRRLVEPAFVIVGKKATVAPPARSIIHDPVMRTSSGQPMTNRQRERAMQEKDGDIPESLPKAHRTFLIVLAQRQGKATLRDQIAVMAGYSASSGHVDNVISKLRTWNLVEGQGELRITEAGLNALGSYETLPTGRDLLNYWLQKLPAGPSKMLRVISEVYPQSITRDEIAERAGYSVESGHVDNCISALRTRELIEGRGEIRMSEELA